MQSNETFSDSSNYFWQIYKWIKIFSWPDNIATNIFLGIISPEFFWHLNYIPGAHLGWEVTSNVYEHYSDIIMSEMASHITSVSIVYSTLCSGTDQRKHQSSASLAFVRGIHRSPVNSPHKGSVTQKIFPFDDVIMRTWLRQKYTCGMNK